MYLCIVPSVMQINIEEVKEEEGHVVVRCIISAASSNHFSSSSAKVHFLTFQKFSALNCLLLSESSKWFFLFVFPLALSLTNGYFGRHWHRSLKSILFNCQRFSVRIT